MWGSVWAEGAGLDCGRWEAGRRVEGGFGSGCGLRGRECVTQAEGLPGIEQAEEDGEVRTPSEQAKDESSAAADDLRRDEDEALQKGAKVHTKQPMLFGAMLLAQARCDAQKQGAPGLDRPGKRGDDHIGPVGLERVERSAQGASAVLELLLQRPLASAMTCC